MPRGLTKKSQQMDNEPHQKQARLKSIKNYIKTEGDKSCKHSDKYRSSFNAN
jgi:hypothetical protein